VTDPIGDSLTFDYLEDDIDTDARLLPRLKIKQITDGDGNRIEYDYDDVNSITRATISGPAGDTRTVAVAYLEDTNDTHQRYVTSQTVNVTLGSSAPQTITTKSVYSNDGRFLPTQAVDPLGNTTSFEYNDYNQTTAVADALGHRREFTYDVNATPTATTPNRYDLVRTFETSAAVDGNTYNIQASFGYASYDAVSSPDAGDTVQSTHRLSVSTDPNGNTSRFDYDDQNNYFALRASRFTDPLGNVSARSYDDHGAVLSETDAVGSIWQWAYDPLGQLLSTTDPNGNTRHWLYDPSTGWLVTATDALGAAGDPAHSIQYEWNDAGQRVRDTDAVGAKTEYAYYSSTRLRSITQYDPTARITSFTFDGVGNLTGLTDPAGNTGIIRYDEANRAYEIAQSGGSPPIQFTRDLAGHITGMTDCNGAVTTYGYDQLGRLISLNEPDWPAAAPVNHGKQIGISYDPQGKRLRVSDSEAVGDYLYHYDPAGNLLERDDPDSFKLLFDYDARNALVRVHDQASTIDLRFTLDGDGRLLTLTDSAYLDPSRTYTYHRTAGTLVDNLYGIDYDSSGIATRFEYDPNGQLTLADHSLSGATLANYGYGYRADGLVGSQTGTQTAAYDYDGRKQLISEGGTHDGYDAAGNRLWRAATSPPVAQQAVFDTQNRMLSDGHGTTYDYDANGNLLKRTPPGGRAPTAYTYDGANRLRLVADGVAMVSYRYDPDGRMIERSGQHGAQAETSGYRYASRSILAELDAHGNIAVLYTRDHDGRLLRIRSQAVPRSQPSQHRHPQLHRLLRRGGRIRPGHQPSQDPHSLYYLSDGLGSVVRMVDWDGKPHLSCDYDAWGGSTASSGIGTFRYRGGYEDSHTRLLSFGARWYEPSLGRWLSPDPLLSAMGAANSDPLPYHSELTNLYRYVLNNPLTLWDPTGLNAQLPKGWPEPPGWKGGFRWKNDGRDRLIDPDGDGWHWHTKDVDHPVEHWDWEQKGRGRKKQRLSREGKDLGEEAFPEEEGKKEGEKTPEEPGSEGQTKRVATGIAAGGGAVIGGVIVWEVIKWAAALGGAPETFGGSLGLLAIP
jgi:RHS repeat-associated protein